MSNQIQQWQEQNPALAQRGIDESMWNALSSTIYPGAKPDSILMAVDYCRARKLDIMLKPVHLVSMSVKDSQSGQYGFRDVPMPGIGMYRIQADRSGNYAGADEPEFGPTVTQDLGGVQVSYPEFCKYTVYKIIGDQRVSFISKEYWLENYATSSKNSDSPNAMWKKRPFAQLAKCAEAQALRKAWPEIGAEPTAEEMEGKSFRREERDVTPRETEPATLPYYPQEQFETNLPKWQGAIEAGKLTGDQVIAKASTKGQLTDDQIAQIREVNNENA